LGYSGPLLDYGLDREDRRLEVTICDLKRKRSSKSIEVIEERAFTTGPCRHGLLGYLGTQGRTP
jgi:hypothetical protein